MIRFFVNNRELILPEDFSFSWTEENPEISSDGEFSLNMQVSLLEKNNAIAFGFLNRKNKLNIDQKADAFLIDNGKSHFGTIIINKNNDSNVDFQFLAGNSELKYMAKNDKKIWELDWGTETEIDYARALLSTQLSGYGLFNQVSPLGENQYYQNNFVCTPVKVNKNGTTIIANNFKFTESINSSSRDENVSSVENIIMQPYLLYYINKFPLLLGYSLKYNVLNSDERAIKMFLINTVDSLKYADALPDLTITEFKEAIESFFNVEFVVDPSDKSVSIISLNSIVDNKKVVDSIVAFDNYTRDFSQKSKVVNLCFSKIKYDFNDTVYFKYHDLNEEILKNIIQVNLSSETEIADYIDDNLTPLPFNSYYLFNISSSGNSYFVGNTDKINLYKLNIGDYRSYTNLINKFKAFGSGDNVLSLKIVPSEIEYNKITLNFTDRPDLPVQLVHQLPVASNNYFISENQNLVEVIEGTLKSLSRNSFIEVALFTGIIEMYNAWYFQDNFHFKYPFSHCDFYPDFGPVYADENNLYAPFEVWRNSIFSTNATTTMRLTGTNGIIADYRHESIIDTSREYVFLMEDNTEINTKNLYQFEQQIYIPIKFESTKSKQKGIVTGYFYRLK